MIIKEIKVLSTKGKYLFSDLMLPKMTVRRFLNEKDGKLFKGEGYSNYFYGVCFT